MRPLNLDSDPSLCQSVLADAPDAVVYADRDGVIRLWNRAAERVFGHAAADAVGRHLDLIIPERFRAAHWAGYERAMASGQTKYAGRAMTTRSFRADGGKLYVELSFGIVKDAGGQPVGVVAFARDVTDRRTSTDSY